VRLLTEANAAATERADRAEARELEIESAAELRRVLLVDATERAKKAEQRATEAEAACAAMRQMLERAANHDCGCWPCRGQCNAPEAAVAWKEMVQEEAREVLASTPIGSGWVSPAEAAEKDARIAALEKALRKTCAFRADVGPCWCDDPTENYHEPRCAELRAALVPALACSTEKPLAPAAAHPTEEAKR
jgi:hypothetical protein